jgi:hypothetical protein
MIAISCYTDTAVFMTDTLAYSKGAAELGHTTKFMPLPHIDTAVLAQGDSWFAMESKLYLLAASQQYLSLDALVEVAPKILAEAWAGCLADAPDLVDSVIFLVGYSDQAKRFVGYGFASEHDFQPFDLGDFWAIPMPWDAKPSTLEVERYRREAAADGVADDVREIFEEWEGKPQRQAPQSLEDWLRLALEIRFNRSTERFCKVLVAGQAFLTIIERNGGIQGHRIVDFNDEGEEWELILAHTRNPVALAIPCDCGSGKTWGDCCLPDAFAESTTATGE